MRSTASSASAPPERDGQGNAPTTLPPRVLALKLLLLLFWLGISFVPAFHASRLDREVWGWPLHYWIGAQGSVIGFLLIIVVDAAVMNRWERRGQDDGTGD